MNRGPMIATALAALACVACAKPGYVIDDAGKIMSQDRFGRVTKTYEPGSPEYNHIASRFWPGEVPVVEDKPKEVGRKAQLNALMRSLDRDQWHILLDMEMWTGDDLLDLAHLEDIAQLAKAVKGVHFADYIVLKDRIPSRKELKDKLLSGER